MPKLLGKNIFSTLFWLLFYAFIFGILLQSGLKSLDPDFGWHLKVGQEIVLSQSVPQANIYNYTFTGNWVDHEWLSNVIIYLIYAHFGYMALAIFFAIIILVVLILLNFYAHRLWPDKNLMFPIVFFQIFGTIAALPHFGVRVQELALLFIVLLLAIIYLYEKSPNWRRLLILPPFFYLWSCLHASFLIGFFLIFAWAAIKIWQNIWRSKNWLGRLNREGSLTGRQIGIFLFFSVISIAATFLTPYRAELYSFLFGYRNTAYLSYINEWVSQFRPPYNYPQLLYMNLVLTSGLIYIYETYRRRSAKLNLWTVFLVSLFLILSFKSRRHFPLLFVVSFLPVINVWSGIFQPPASRPSRILRIYIIACLFLTALWQFVQIRPIDPFTSFCHDYPCGAIQFLKGHPEYADLKIFNDYGWGGYLIAAYPERLLFIDGRLPQVAYAGHSFLEEYREFLSPQANGTAKLQQYDIRLVLLKAHEKPLKFRRWERILLGLKDEDFRWTNKLADYVSQAPDWQLIYSDDTAHLYLNK